MVCLTLIDYRLYKYLNHLDKFEIYRHNNISYYDVVTSIVILLHTVVICKPRILF